MTSIEIHKLVDKTNDKMSILMWKGIYALVFIFITMGATGKWLYTESEKRSEAKINTLKDMHKTIHKIDKTVGNMSIQINYLEKEHKLK